MPRAPLRVLLAWGSLSGCLWAILEGVFRAGDPAAPWFGNRSAGLFALLLLLHAGCEGLLFLLLGRAPGSRRALARLAASPVLTSRPVLLAGLLLPPLLAALAFAGRPAAWQPVEVVAPDSSGLPDLLLFSIDTTRADRLSAYGFERETTPFLAQLAAEGVRCESAFSPLGLTGPAHATVLTGASPHRHGALRNGWVPRASSTPIFPLLQEAGYATAAAVSAFHLNPRYGFGRGIDHFEPVGGRLAATLQPAADWLLIRLLRPLLLEGPAFVRPGAATIERAEVAWEALGDAQPRALWLHIFEPHWPYTPPAEYAAMFRTPLRTRRGGEGLDPQVAAGMHRIAAYRPKTVVAWSDAYDAELRQADDLLRRAVQRFRTAGRPLIVVIFSDHGEALGEHYATDHGDLLYDEQLRVPLILWSSDERVPRGRRVEQPVGLADVAPTLLDLLGIRAEPFSPDGASFRQAFADDQGAWEAQPQLLAVEGRLVRILGVRDERWKLIHNLNPQIEETFRIRADGRGAAWWKGEPNWRSAEVELYDLASDPLELTNLAGRVLPPPALRQALERFEASAAPLSVQTQEHDRATVEGIRALGYTDG